MKLKKDLKINRRATYALVNSKTKKILKYCGKLEYYRTVTLAGIRKRELQKELGIDLEVVKLK